MSRHTESTSQTPDDQVRLDRWLWAARFFKTRQLAIEAINGGKVHLNGHRAKPGKNVCVGTQLTITKEPYSWDISVTALNTQRRPAQEAVQLYNETPESVARRHEELARQREEREQGILPEGRPNKRERRLIHRFKRIDTHE